MTEPTWHRTHLVVPRADETLLASPHLDEAAAAALSNSAALDSCDIDVQGRPLSRLRNWARAEAARLAHEFTSAGRFAGDAGELDPSRPLVVTGHQPLLYHPGVWAKNFAAAGVARRVGGGAINLIVDNDLYARSAIDAPAGTRDQPHKEPIPFDVARKPRPWEAAYVEDALLFGSFGDRAAAHIRGWGVDPLVAEHWSEADRAVHLGASLPESLTALRRAVETRWGLENLELPMSTLCESEPFLWFVGHVLAQSTRFAAAYNGVLSDYRRVYRIKSKNHPVPVLEERGDWIEAPFWVWRDDASGRRRVFVRQSERTATLADDAGRVFATLPLSPTMDACCAVEVLKTLPAQRIRLRTRALTTTLFARLFLADTFVHGIGGAKYDEMTDRIIARFFGIPAPAYATVSASLYLPFAEPFDVTGDDDRRLVTLLRDLETNPQRHLSGSSAEADRLLEERQALVADQDAAWAAARLSRRARRLRSPANRRRFQRLREVTSRLAALTAGQRECVREELSVVRRARRANQVLAAREFSFVLYPEEKLRPFLSALAGL